jgi:hypothetical protein
MSARRQRIRADKLAHKKPLKASRRITSASHPTFPMPVITDRDRAILSEAVHRTVCEQDSDGQDGYRKCLLYAIAGMGLLMNRGFSLQAGTLVILADPHNPKGAGSIVVEAAEGGWERGEYHCWLARPTNPPELVDFSARHFKRATEDHWGRTINPAPQLVGPMSIPWASQGGTDTSIQWLREDPPDALWLTDKIPPHPLALYHARVETTDAVQRLLMDNKEATARVVLAAKRHYRALGGTL